MRKNLFVVTLMVLWFSTVSAHASTIWTVDGPSVSFLADTDVTLVPGADGQLDFSDFTINAGSLVNFDAIGLDSISIYSIGDITINGTLDALGYNLFLKTEGDFTLGSGAVVKCGDMLTIDAYGVLSTGTVGDGKVPSGGAPVELIPGEIITFPEPAPVPEPTTLLLLGCGLVAIAGMGRRIQFHS